MNHQLLRQALCGVVPRLGRIPAAAHSGAGESKGSRQRSQTTVLALHFRDGILMAGDRRVTAGYTEIFTERMVKIQQASVTAALLGSGMVSSMQWLGDELRDAARNWMETTGYPLSVTGLAKFAAACCSMASASWPWMWSFDGILVGCDVDGAFRIFSVEESGSRIELSTFCATGSGGRVAKAILRVRWNEYGGRMMSAQEAVKLAVEALIIAGMNDSGTSDAELAVPSVAAISREAGFEFASEDEIHTVVHQLLPRYRVIS